MTPDSTRRRTDPDHLDIVTGRTAAAAAVVGFDVAVFAALRYAPEYLRLLGNGPLFIGLFGSLAALAGLVYPALDAGLDRLGSLAGPVLAGLASFGLVCWLLVPQVGAGRPTTLVFVGLFLVGLWPAFDLGIGLDAVVPRHVAERVPHALRHDRASRYAAILLGLLALVWVLVEVSPARAAIQVVLGLAAGLGLTTAVFLAVRDDSTTGVLSSTSGEPSTARRRRLRGALAAFRSLPRASRQLALGETLVALAVGMVSVFLVITVTSVLRIDIVLLGFRFRPDAFFGLCLLAETLVALVAPRPLDHLADRLGRERVATALLLVAALFPVALVAAPANPAVVAALFAAFGLYHAGLPLGRRAVESTLDADDVDRYRLLRAAVRVPTALIGGVVYAASPTLAFGLATVVGAVGVREFLVGATWPVEST
ncbi:transporter [Halococcus salsus]|uniref:transporter n=1 Tax=Halococcus salsus TaxID=2162894 RepID=UPI0013592F8B|nr:transporter [Halococcus salsus]